MNKFLYFRGVANLAADDDGTAGSLLMPLSKLKGMTMGTAAITGAVTDDEDAFTLFFEPAGIGFDGDVDAGDNDVIFYDKHAGHDISWKDSLYRVIRDQDVVLVE